MEKDKAEMNEVVEDTLIKEHEKWKFYSPSFYDLVITHALESASLTVQWLPDRDVISGDGYSAQKMILGTCTPNGPDYLMVLEFRLPPEDKWHDAKRYVDLPSGHGRFPSVAEVQVIQKIKHDEEVNRARYMPQNSSIIATNTVSGQVHVFDCSKHPSEPPLNAACNPDLRLKGHIIEGYSLSWSQLEQGHLLSGSHDGQICLWDINATPSGNILEARQIYKVNGRIIEDVAWDLRDQHLFGSVGHDQYLNIWDTRSPSTSKPVQSVIAHESLVNCLAFIPSSEWMVATGSSDKTVKLFDSRKINNALHTFDCHNEVLQIGCNPKDNTILASRCVGRRLMVWDISRIGKQQSLEDLRDGQAEILFVHCGHMGEISDFSWNPCQDWTIASVSVERDVLQIWQMRKAVCDKNTSLLDRIAVQGNLCHVLDPF